MKNIIDFFKNKPEDHWVYNALTWLNKIFEFLFTIISFLAPYLSVFVVVFFVKKFIKDINAALLVSLSIVALFSGGFGATYNRKNK
jgi:hypothetical protein